MLHPQLGSYVRHYGRPYQALFPKWTWRRPTRRREVYLTFDDGPLPGGTDAILDILASEGIAATFFCVGQNVRRHPQLLHRIVSEGHAWGNHAFDHRSGWRTPVDRYVEGVHRCQRLLPPRVGRRPLFRPPFGKLTPSQARHLENDFEIVMWDIMSGDFDPSTDPERVENLLIRKVRPGSILLFHDDGASIAKNRVLLPRVTACLRDMRFLFGTL